MRPFRFRAEATLDIRRKHDEAAQRSLGVARAAARSAAVAVTITLERIETANRDAAKAWQADGCVDQLIWQGNWMVALQRDVSRARQTLLDRESEERRAAEIAQHARMQVRVLERLKERALRAWQLDVRRAEQKALDELASLRFVARARAAEE
jgi:flagellar export protein FliJ